MKLGEKEGEEKEGGDVEKGQISTGRKKKGGAGLRVEEDRTKIEVERERRAKKEIIQGDSTTIMQDEGLRSTVPSRMLYRLSTGATPPATRPQTLQLATPRALRISREAGRQTP